MGARARVFCAGIVVADVFVPALNQMPGPGDLVTTEEFLVSSGGCASNTARCLSGLGYESAVIGRVGNDPFGEFVRTDLARHGVDVRGVATSTRHGTSKTVIITVVGDDRRYLHTVGANADLETEDLDAALMEQPAALYVGGYLVLPGLSPAGLATRFERARVQGAYTILDVVAPRGEDGSRMELLRPVLPFVDVFMPNEAESRSLTGKRDAIDQAQVFIGAGCKVAIITMGKDGALLATSDIIMLADAPSVHVADESGAGDAFAAGFIAGIVDGLSLEGSLRLASVLGASACRRLGCYDGVFTRPEASKFLEDHPLHVQILPRDKGPSEAVAQG